MRHRPILEIERDLQDALDLIEDIRQRGNAAISDYDLMMGYDANYYVRPSSCLFAHVAWYQQELEKAAAHGEQLALEI